MPVSSDFYMDFTQKPRAQVSWMTEYQAGFFPFQVHAVWISVSQILKMVRKCLKLEAKSAYVEILLAQSINIRHVFYTST